MVKQGKKAPPIEDIGEASQTGHPEAGRTVGSKATQPFSQARYVPSIIIRRHLASSRLGKDTVNRPFLCVAEALS